MGLVWGCWRIEDQIFAGNVCIIFTDVDEVLGTRARVKGTFAVGYMQHEYNNIYSFILNDSCEQRGVPEGRRRPVLQPSRFSSETPTFFP